MAELLLAEPFTEPLPEPPSTLPVRLATKLYPPPPMPGLVPRRRLLRLLEQGADRKLTLVVAAAGFGKTTLLSQWASSSSRPVAWLSLDEGDRDPFRLWTHVVGALARPLPELDRLAALDLPLDELITTLLDELTGLPAAVLVLDDYDRLGRGASEGSLRWFAERVPASLQVVVSSRSDPPFPLGIVRARGDLLELRAADLQLSDLEARTLLATARGRMDPAGHTRLLEVMEGWPAGLRLGLDARPGQAERSVSELLEEEVLGALDQETRGFLVRGALLERLSGPLCDAVLDRTGSAELLERLERENAFVVALDERREWYRLHRSFATALRRELISREPALVPELHRRASAWHRRAGNADEAIEHALAAGSFAEAAAILARTWQRHLDDGTRRRPLKWLDRLPLEVVEASPRLSLAHAWLCYLDGRPDEGKAALLAAQRPVCSNRIRARIGRQVDLVRGAVVWDDVDSALAAGRRGLTASRHEAPGPLALWAAGWPLWWRGELDQARTLLTGALHGPALVSCAAGATLARIAVAQGHLEDATRLAERAYDSARRCGLADLPELGMVPTAVGVALAAQGDPASAQPLLEQGLRLRRSWGHPLEIADGLIVLAPVAAALDGRSRAANLLTEAGEILGECPDSGALAEQLTRARSKALPRPSRGGRVAGLSARELSVLRLLASGRSKREISTALQVSFNTIHSHTKSIYRKLGVSNRAEALACARDLELL